MRRLRSGLELRVRPVLFWLALCSAAAARGSQHGIPLGV
ncbi:voltage-dependent calcium channel subunit alpha-2/delta-3 isoform X1, partial [Tachysurus ichikawai]